MSSERVLSNARVVSAERVFVGSVLLRDGLIAAVDEGRSHLAGAEDLGGDYLLPGLVELHTDTDGLLDVADLAALPKGRAVVLASGSRPTLIRTQPWMTGPHAKGEVLSVAFAGEGQFQDTGAKMVHMAPYTSSNIVSKSVARSGGRAAYRGLVQINKDAHHSASNVECDALLVDSVSRSDTYPYNDIRNDHVTLGHEATVSQVSEDQLFYLMSRGIEEDEAMAMIVRGFVEPIAKELPMEYALELNRLIELQMEGSVG